MYVDPRLNKNKSEPSRLHSHVPPMLRWDQSSTDEERLKTIHEPSADCSSKEKIKLNKLRETASATRCLTSLPNRTSRSSCCHRHGCIYLVDTRTSRDPVMIRFCFVPEIRFSYSSLEDVVNFRSCPFSLFLREGLP
jgi:hypothetical protein